MLPSGRERLRSLGALLCPAGPHRSEGAACRGRSSPVRRETADLQESRHGAMTELSRASLPQLILEERAALKTLVDFADLEREGVLKGMRPLNLEFGLFS